MSFKPTTTAHTTNTPTMVTVASTVTTIFFGNIENINAIIGGGVATVTIVVVAVVLLVALIVMYGRKKSRYFMLQLAFFFNLSPHPTQFVLFFFYRRKLFPVILTGVHSSSANETELYEVMDAGHYYEDVSKYQDKRENESEYEVVEQTLVAAVVRSRKPSSVPHPTSAASHSTLASHTTQTLSFTQQSLHPQPQVVDEADFEITECAAYQTVTHNQAATVAPPTEDEPLYI